MTVPQRQVLEVPNLKTWDNNHRNACEALYPKEELVKEAGVTTLAIHHAKRRLDQEEEGAIGTA
jgi:hypothetical protein